MTYVIRFASGEKVFESESEDAFENELEKIVESMPYDIDMFGTVNVSMAVIDNGDF